MTRKFIIVLTALSFVTSARAEDPVDFQQQVRPILADTCYTCHGPDSKKRKAGLRLDIATGASKVLSPGKPTESKLIARITSTDKDEVMPPANHLKRLSDQDRAILIDWVKQGATWKSHWAYETPGRYSHPQVRDRDWPINFIDYFILNRLEAEKIRPSPTADRTTLLRRLSFDLTGLPPSVQDVDEFTSDDSDTAYSRVVDRLLNSPHFGERMAIYWLDLVRYADTVGYHGDQPVSVSPYRDYVINAFNKNMPFDQFTREQLAGDLLPNPNRAQTIASGYNRLGMMSAEGGVQPKEYLAKYAADRVRTASAVWLGSTLGCAECHDHKYDPFQSRDFYRFAAFFADIKERGLYSGAHASGRWGPQIDVPDDDLPGLLVPIDAELKKLNAIVDTPTKELAAAQTDWENHVRRSPTWQILETSGWKSSNGTTLKKQPDGSYLASGKSPNTDSYVSVAAPQLSSVKAIRFEVLPHKSLPKDGPGRAGNGNFVLTELRVDVRAQGETEWTETKLHAASATIEQSLGGNATPYKKWSATSAIDNDVKGKNWGWAILPEVGKKQSLVARFKEPLTDVEQIRVTLDQNHKNPKHTIGRFRVSVTNFEGTIHASPQQEMPDSIRAILVLEVQERSPQQAKEIAAHFRSIAPSLGKTRSAIEMLANRRVQTVKAHTRTSLVTTSVPPREMRVLARGNWMDVSGEIVEPGIPEFLPQLVTTDRATRLDLANWLTSQDNPLTARVMTNRFWRMFFGVGLSKILDDVGSQGEPPTHPALLDTLAVEFIESGWNIKHMIKLIVMSRAYRQSSMARAEIQTIDPYNRLFAKQARFRLDAEMIRDNALAVSGLLAPHIGGRSAKPYQPAGLYVHLNFPARKYQHDNDYNQYRRGVYTHWQRQFLHPAMKTFDAPSREECSAERPRSNTPLGALLLLNDPTYVEAARVLAVRGLTIVDSSDKARLEWLMNQTMSRDTTTRERDILMKLLRSQRVYFQAHQAKAKALIAIGLSPYEQDFSVDEVAAWASVTRALMNMHEFITRN